MINVEHSLIHNYQGTNVQRSRLRKGIVWFWFN